MMGAGLGTLPLPATVRELQTEFDGARGTQPVSSALQTDVSTFMV